MINDVWDEVNAVTYNKGKLLGRDLHVVLHYARCEAVISLSKAVLVHDLNTYLAYMHAQHDANKSFKRF